MLVHNIEWIVDGAIRFIKMPRRRGNFFLYVGWTLPHNPEVQLRARTMPFMPYGEAGLSCMWSLQVLDSLQADPRYTPGGMWAANRTQVHASRERACRTAHVSTEVCCCDHYEILGPAYVAKVLLGLW